MQNTLDFSRYLNLASANLGAEAIFVTDDFFAEVSRMLADTDAVFKADLFDDNGKWMDGWESRRKRAEGYDYAIVKLAMPGNLKGLDLDTSNFTGNFAPSASVDACYSPNGAPTAETQWTEILSAVSLKGDTHHLFELNTDKPFTHVRLNIFPDGGVARLRVYGQPLIDWDKIDATTELDLAAVENGGRALACNDQHFGKMDNIIMPGNAANMGEGWETARRRTPGNDWVILALGHPGEIKRVLLDTAHFKGNFPDSFNLQAAYVKGGTDDQIETQSLFWRELLPAQKLTAHNIHEFANQLNNIGPVTHVRLNIFPDGGLSRIRLFGTKA